MRGRYIDQSSGGGSGGPAVSQTEYWPTSGTCCAHHRRSDSDHVQRIFNSSHSFAKLFSNDVIVVASNSNLRLNSTVSAFATYCEYLTSTSKLTCPSLSTESNVIDAWICSLSVCLSLHARRHSTAHDWRHNTRGVMHGSVVPTREA